MLVGNEDARASQMRHHLSELAAGLGDALNDLARAIDKGRVGQHAHALSDGAMVTPDRQYSLIGRTYGAAWTEIVLLMGRLDDWEASQAAAQRERDLEERRRGARVRREELGRLSPTTLAVVAGGADEEGD